VSGQGNTPVSQSSSSCPMGPAPYRRAKTLPKHEPATFILIAMPPALHTTPCY
jgi:hypothetical protein